MLPRKGLTRYPSYEDEKTVIEWCWQHQREGIDDHYARAITHRQRLGSLKTDQDSSQKVSCKGTIRYLLVKSCPGSHDGVHSDQLLLSSTSFQAVSNDVACKSARMRLL